MEFPLYADLFTGKLVNSEGSSLTIPPLVLGDVFRGTLRFLERTEDGVREKDLNVRTIRASIGKTMEPSTSGTFTLRGRLPQRMPAQVTVSPETARYLQAVSVVDDGMTVYAVDSVSGGAPMFESLEASRLWFIANNEAEYFSISDPATDGSFTITAQLRGDDRQIVVTVRDLNDEGLVLEDFEGPQLMPVDSAPIGYDATPENFSALVAPILPEAPAEVSLAAAGCWLFRLASGAQFELEAGPSNRLEPISFPRVRIFQRFGAEWWAEVRLIQAPLAWNEAGHERILPPPPSVRRVRGGDAGSDTQPAVNELQALHVPANFRGTYFVKWNFRVAKVLGNEDGPEAIADALNGMYADQKVRFEVTNPELEHAYIEFVGELAGVPQPLITLEVNTFAPGVITFEMPLSRTPMVDALRKVASIEAPLEIEIEYVGDDEDPEDPLVMGKTLTIAQHQVTITREQIWRELATVQNIDWLRPPAARSYRPFSPNQIVVGHQHYASAFGDGALRSFSFAHNLATDAFQFCVRENQAGGRVLVHGEEYTLTIPSENEVVLDIPEGQPTPGAGALAILLTTAGQRSSFLDHDHEIAQIIGLEQALELLGARLTAVESLMPSSTLARREASGDTQEIKLPVRTELFPGQLPANLDLSKLGTKITGARPGALLPAVHKAAVVAWSGTALPVARTNPDTVWQVAAGKSYVLPRGSGSRSRTATAGDLFASDGRMLYAVRQSPPESGTAPSTSYFPVDFERELFLLHVNEAQWQPGGRVEVEFAIELQTVMANTRAQWLVVIEAGTAPGQTTPAPVGTNLADITWAAKPLLIQRVVVSEVRVRHKFGAILKRSTGNAITGERMHYTAWSAAPAEAVPTEPGVVLRARLIQFDTENSVKGASGFVYYSTVDAKAKIS